MFFLCPLLPGFCADDPISVHLWRSRIMLACNSNGLCLETRDSVCSLVVQ